MQTPPPTVYVDNKTSNVNNNSEYKQLHDVSSKKEHGVYGKSQSRATGSHVTVTQGNEDMSDANIPPTIYVGHKLPSKSTNLNESNYVEDDFDEFDA